MGALDKTSFAIATSFETIPPLNTITGFEGLWFKSIPPERVGLNGEYDYYGLAKRVRYCLREQAMAKVQGLKIRQRGRVILLSGHLASGQDLKHIVKLVMAVEGVDAVEAQGVTLAEVRKAVPA